MRSVTRRGPRRLPIPSFLFVVAALFAALPLVVTGNVLVGALVAVRLNLASIDAATVGYVLALHSVGFVFGSRFALPIIHRVGHIRAFAAFAAITCSQALAYPLHESVWSWGLWRLVGGITVAGMMAVIESWVSARASSQNRGRLLSSYMVVYYLAAAAGQLLIGLTEVSGFVPFSVAAVLIVLSVVPLALGRTEAPLAHVVPDFGLAELYRLVPLGVVGAACSGVVVSAFMSLGPFYAWEIGMDAQQLSLFMSFAVLAAMLSQLPVGWLSDRVGRLGVFVGVVIIGLGAALGGTLLGATAGVMSFGIAAVFIGSVATLYPLSLAITHDNLSHEQVLPANTTILLCYGLGTCIGPVGAAYAIRQFGPGGLYGFSGCALLALLLFTLTRLRAPRPAEEDRGEFVIVPQVTTPVLTEIDPRGDLPPELGGSPVETPGRSQ